ncbi:hypothetical protein [Chryseobacterium defluvii]|uniref:Uncharacterized protein n=1 Tax=Chryseobacterium defluvii TaxID=160396 RepID=A0A495S9Q0_9FLAO|nr:hypothetical protein [Chryseobacterium defluvii]RKS96623.1 hypothetical protein BCF58_3054 [Chryseobacterium defluvii]
MKKKMIYIYLIIGFLPIFIVVYMYLNPSIDNKDFDLEYRISRGEKKYAKARNNNYSDNDYRFNHLGYCNDLEGRKLIIHSLDKESNGKERVIFVVKDAGEKFPTATIDYFGPNNNFNLFKIKYVADSIFIWKKKSVVQEKEELFFKGEKCR